MQHKLFAENSWNATLPLFIVGTLEDTSVGKGYEYKTVTAVLLT